MPVSPAMRAYIPELSNGVDRALTIAYELFYAFKTTTTTFEFACFLVWFLFDISFAAVAIFSAYPSHRRKAIILHMTLGVVAGVLFLNWLCGIWPDEREQVTAFWTGVVLQLPISVVSVLILITRGDTEGHSLEIW